MEVNGLRIRVEKVEDRKVVWALVEKLPPAPPEEEKESRRGRDAKAEETRPRPAGERREQGRVTPPAALWYAFCFTIS